MTLPQSACLPATATRSRVLALMILLTAAQPALAQDAPPGFRDEFLGQFNYSAQRLLALAEAMPAETFAWSPGEGVMSVERVYMHIARYNYYYPESSLGHPAPEDVDVANLEEITGKEVVIGHLGRSLDHVRDLVREMPEEAFERTAPLYGRDVAGWAVLLQLLAHMNEHVGQSIAYARTNGVTPPWSR